MGRKSSRWIAAALGAALGVPGLGVPGLAMAGDVKVAVVGPMTGQYASFGEQLRRGAELAVQDINAAGGVLGSTLKLQVGDDACDPKQAVAVANDLAAQNVALVDGHFCSSSSIPASGVYAEAGMLQITPASTNPKLTDDAAAKGWWNIFRACGRDDQQTAVAVKYLIEHHKAGKIAILNDKSAAGRSLADDVKGQLNAAGITEALFDSVNQGDRDFSAVIGKMKVAGVEAIYYGGYHTEAALIARQSAEAGLKAQLIGPDSLMTSEFWSISGPGGEGVLMTFAPDPTVAPEAKAIVERFKAQGFNPEGYTLYSYAAMQVYAQGALWAGSLDNQKIAEALHSGRSIDTVIGKIGYDKKGDIVEPQFILYVWHDGKYKPL